MRVVNWECEEWRMRMRRKKPLRSRCCSWMMVLVSASRLSANTPKDVAFPNADLCHKMGSVVVVVFFFFFLNRVKYIFNPLNIWFSKFDLLKKFYLILIPYFLNIINISPYYQLSAVKYWRDNIRFWHVLMLIRSHIITSALNWRQELILITSEK